MIAYGFPPEGNAGSYRPLRFARHLPELDWHPTVVTLDSENYERYDSSLLEQVPADIDIIRVHNRDPWQVFQARRSERIQKQLAKASPEQTTHILTAQQNPMRSRARELVRSIEAWCYHPDPAMGWIRPAVKATLKACQGERPDVIWATAGPVSSLVVAAKVSRRIGVPYVLDFRDAWTITFNEFEARRPAWAWLRIRRTMRQLLEGAQSVVFLYDTMAECFRSAYPGAVNPDRVHIIPNGFDGEIDTSKPPKGDKCNVLYAGTLSSYRFDSLLEALVQLKRCDPAVAGRLRMTFIGEAMEPLAQEVGTRGLKDIVETKPTVTHAEILEIQRQAHAVLLLGRPRSMKGYELFASAKLFGYLKSGRPIIGVLPEDESKKILRRVGVTTVADAESPSEIVCALYQLVKAWSEGRLESRSPDRLACEAYSAERQTAALVKALEGNPAPQAFVPGPAQIPDSLREEMAGNGWSACEASG